MFNALDHMNGWQLISVLLPVVLIMTFIRHREERAGSIRFESMNGLQKGWVFLSLLTPGLAARILALLEDDERQRIIEAGGSLTGSAGKAALPVLDVFFKSGGEKAAPSKDVQEVCRFLNLKYEENPKQLLGTYRKAYL